MKERIGLLQLRPKAFFKNATTFGHIFDLKSKND